MLKLYHYFSLEVKEGGLKVGNVFEMVTKNEGP